MLGTLTLALSLSSAPLRLETTSIVRDVPFDLGTGAASAIGREQFLDRGVAEEQLLSNRDSMEHAWIFDHPLRGDGDLIVRVAFDGAAYAGWSASGHHFVDDVEHHAFVYGEAFWIDAVGARWPVRVELHDGALELNVPAEAIDRSIYPAMLDPTISAEIDLLTPPTGASSADQIFPAADFDGSQYLIVWADYREGFDQDLYAARMNGAGAVDDVSFPIVRGIGPTTEPAIAYGGGGNHLLVWRDQSGTDADIVGAIIDGTGFVLVPSFVIGNGAGHQQLPAVTFDGVNFVVVWQDPASGIDAVSLRLVSLAGAPLGNTVSVPASVNYQRQPSVACGATNCLVCWHEGPATNEDVWCARESDGAIIDPAALRMTTATGLDRRAAVAYDSTMDQYLVAWQRNDIVAARVRASDGVLLDSPPLVINNATSNQVHARAVFDGTQFLVIWSDTRSDGRSHDMYSARVQSSGAVTDPTGILLNGSTGNQYQPQLVLGSGQALAVWEDYRAERPDIYGSRIDANAASLDPGGIAISRSMGRAHSPSMAFDGTNFFVVFNRAETTGDGAGGFHDIGAVRLSAAGAILDGGAGRDVYVGTGNQSAPYVSWNGTQFFVVWADSRNGDWDVYGTRVSNTYDVLDPAGIPIATGPGDQTLPAIDYNSNAGRYLVAWQSNSTGNNEIVGTRLETTGARVDATDIQIGIGTGQQTRPDVSAGTVNWFVVWIDGRNAATTGTDIYGRAVSNGGNVLAEQILVNATGAQETPRVIFNRGRGQFVSVWSDRRNALDTNIYARTISSATGVVQAPAEIAIATTAVTEARPAIVQSANRYFVSWLQQSATRPSEYDLYGRRFTFNFVPVEATPLALSTEALSEDAPALDARGSRNDVVVYQRYDDDPTARTMRLFARRVTF